MSASETIGWTQSLKPGKQNVRYALACRSFAYTDWESNKLKLIGHCRKTMAKPAKQIPPEDRPSEIVYRKTPADADGPGVAEKIQVRVREIAPALMPLIVGFALLLGLIAALGVSSQGIMSNVS